MINLLMINRMNESFNNKEIGFIVIHFVCKYSLVPERYIYNI